MSSRRVLTKKQAQWAWKKRCEGYTTQDIAKALYVDVSTVTRYWIELYNRTKPTKEDKIPLRYEGE